MVPAWVPANYQMADRATKALSPIMSDGQSKMDATSSYIWSCLFWHKEVWKLLTTFLVTVMISLMTVGVRYSYL